MNTILQNKIEEAATFLFKQRGLDKESCRQAMDYILSNQWISVEEALPEYEEVVIVADKINGDYEYYFNHRSDNPNVIKDKNDFCSYRWQNDEQITHWMPIPSLEGGEK